MHLHELPTEILLCIGTYLSLADICRLGKTCQQLYEFHRHPLLWRRVDWRGYGAHIQDEDLCWVATVAHVHLQVLRLKACIHITPKGFMALFAHATYIQELSIQGSHSFGAKFMLQDIVPATQCHTLTVENCPFIDSFSFPWLVDKFIHVRRLTLANCSNHLDIKPLRRLTTQLVELQLNNTYTANEQIVEVLRHCPQIHRLNLDECYKVNDSTLLAIARYLSNLQSLGAKGCSDITAQGVLYLASCSRLEVLMLRNCRAVPDDTFDTLAAAVPLKKVLTPLGKWRFWVS
ncbi:F-box and leucine-rich repeat protein 4 [Dimargaris verticillata]|uniref:F-box and leucine-rich repeat protein 4 n=1 Tax=Dimargaris verticillata TaxID=2761393 RepID=A0A9W8BAJ9_9FUNG|nr:F-box and leucine-rich repeat protein 4 [Dimargaris verticillata]